MLIASAMAHMEAAAADIAALRRCEVPLNHQERSSLSRIAQACYRDRRRLQQIADRIPERDVAAMGADDRFFYGLAGANDRPH